MNSWDRFEIPYPFTRGLFVYGEAMHVPRDVSGEAFEQKQQELEERIKALCLQAEQQV